MQVTKRNNQLPYTQILMYLVNVVTICHCKTPCQNFVTKKAIAIIKAMHLTETNTMSKMIFQSKKQYYKSKTLITLPYILHYPSILFGPIKCPFLLYNSAIQISSTDQSTGLQHFSKDKKHFFPIESAGYLLYCNSFLNCWEICQNRITNDTLNSQSEELIIRH